MINNFALRILLNCPQSVNVRFHPYAEIETDAVFNLDEDVLLTTDEVCFMMFMCVLLICYFSTWVIRQVIIRHYL